MERHGRLTYPLSLPHACLHSRTQGSTPPYPKRTGLAPTPNRQARPPPPVDLLPAWSRRLCCCRRYFCKWLATFSRVRPSTFIIRMIVLGTASARGSNRGSTPALEARRLCTRMHRPPHAPPQGRGSVTTSTAAVVMGCGNALTGHCAAPPASRGHAVHGRQGVERAARRAAARRAQGCSRHPLSTPSLLTALTKHSCSWGVHTSRGRLTARVCSQSPSGKGGLQSTLQSAVPRSGAARCCRAARGRPRPCPHKTPSRARTARGAPSKPLPAVRALPGGRRLPGCPLPARRSRPPAARSPGRWRRCRQTATPRRPWTCHRPAGSRRSLQPVQARAAMVSWAGGWVGGCGGGWFWGGGGGG